MAFLRDGPLENLWGGGGRAKYKKNIRTRENYMKKNHACQLTQKLFMLCPKTKSYKKFDNKKNLAARKSLPP